MAALVNAVPTSAIGPPLWLLAELTYRCPLHCVFCYNPVDFAQQADELRTEDWFRVLQQGRELGAVQLAGAALVIVSAAVLGRSA